MKPFLTVFFLYSLTISGVTAADELVSFELVRQSFGSVEVRKPYAASMSVRAGDSLDLVSDAGYNFGLSVTKTTYSPLGNRIIHASTDGGGKALIVADKAGGLLGSITEFGERHQISTSGKGQRRIFKQGYSGREKRIDDGGAPPKADMLASRLFFDLKEEELSSSPSRAMRAERSSDVIYPTYKTGTAKISVLMYYDDSMSNVFSTVDFITQVANDAYADSGAKIQIDIVGTKALNIDDEASHRDLKTAMNEGEAPFEEIESDRSFFEADLVFILRDTEAPDGGDLCGLGSYGVYQQNHYRSQFTGLVQWNPADGVSAYCSDTTFAHEVGHILGAAHDRTDRTEDGEMWLGAYTYSHGTALDGAFRTVMGVSNKSSSSELYLFSSPSLNCNGYPCGKPASSKDSADNVSTFHGTGHLIASNEGPFAFEAVSAYAVDGEDQNCEDNGESGWWKSHGISNQYRETLNVAELHYIRENGSARSYSYDKGERTLAAGTSRYYGWCDTESNAAYTDFVETFARYYHPDTDELVETSHVYFKDDYDGQYSVIRVATSVGGKVIGHPEQHVRVGSSQTFAFTPESGYEVANIQSNCAGRKSGNRYTVDVDQDNCFIDVAFQQTSVDGTLSEIQVTEAYIGLLDRAPDPDGLAYWVSQLNRAVAAGQDATFAMKKLTNDIALSPEWTAGLGANDATTQIGANAVVQGMYQNLFERAATQADLDWWTPQLTGGSTTAPEMALNLITAAKSNTEKPADGNVLGFKQEAATYYVQNVPQANHTAASARSAVKDVNDAESLAESKTATDLVKAGRLVSTSSGQPVQRASSERSFVGNSINDVGAPSARILAAPIPSLPLHALLLLTGLLSLIGLRRLQV